MKKTIFLAILMAALTVRGQSLVPEIRSSSGNSFKAEGFMLDWTMGEFSTQTYQSEGYSGLLYLTEGFHQPDFQLIEESDLSLSIEETSLSFKVYPNPVKDKLFIETTSSEKYFIELRSIAGGLVYKGQLNDEIFIIEMNSYKEGVYLLKIYNYQRIFNVIKITKSN